MGKQFFEDTSMNVLKNSLSAVTLRHKAISNNIANVNTPNYKRQLVKFEDEMQKQIKSFEGQIPLVVTHPGHIPLYQTEFLNIKPTITSEDMTNLRSDGNNIDIDLELAVLAENTVKFNVLSQTISKKLSQLRSVIRGGGN